MQPTLDGATFSIRISIELSAWGVTAYVFMRDKDNAPERAQVSALLPDVKSARLWARLNFPSAKVYVRS